MFGDPPLSESLILRLLEDAWSLRVVDVQYAAIGYGSYHWRATSAEGSRLLVTADRDDLRPVGAAYELAHRLAEAGLSFVRAPVRQRDGGVAWHQSGWLITLWPWLDGSVGSGLEHESSVDLAATLRCVRRLHDHAAAERIPELTEDWRIPDRSGLFELLALPAADGPSGPFAEEVRLRLARNEGRLRKMFSRYDQLVTETRSAEDDFVITHGEPHAGNVVHTDDGVMLIDWDTVRWAPRERDLWRLIDQPGWNQAYGSDIALSENAVEVYRLQWALVDITDFATSLAQADETNADLEVAVRELRRNLPI